MTDNAVTDDAATDNAATDTAATDTAVSGPRIVVGVDGSEQSKHALRWAAWLAARQGGATIEAVMVWQAPTAFEFNWTKVIGDWDPQADTEKSLNAIIDDVFAADRPAQLKLVVVEGNAARTLIDRAHDATTLIVGNRGRGGFASMALGSVSVRCVEHASCPVLVIRGDYLPPKG